MTTEEHSQKADVGEVIELSSDELAAISGGIDISFTGIIFEQSETFSAQQTQTDSGTQTSYSTSSHLSFSVFQFTGSFESMNDAVKVINRLFSRFMR